MACERATQRNAVRQAARGGRRRCRRWLRGAGEQRLAARRRRRGSGSDGAMAWCRLVGCAISTKSRRRERWT
ncbi:hypothetical protein Syun_001611 [Stephania yunnanensis]|uniref:Uncharacterized protein n=1 Tax=Stephania yunnanensis TaxID=152371 RepID=A0AAP0LEF8_9MAGN